MKDVVIVSAARTAIGSFGGVFKDVKANDLGRAAAEEAVRRAGISKDIIEEVIFGNCFMMTDEINIARVVGLKMGVPATTPAFTVQRQCASSMQALVCGMQQIQTGEIDVALIGGVESMSTAPYILKTARWGLKLRDSVLVDTLWEGLTDPVTGKIMGFATEGLAEKYSISREEQDELAFTSQSRAVSAIDTGRFADEIVPYPIPQRKGDPKIIDTDEHPRRGVTIEGLAKLRPVFKKDGTITPGNSSGINDGAAAAVIMSMEKADALGMKPLARIVSHAVAAVEPDFFGIGPVDATKKALERAGKDLEAMELIELNEAFAAQYLACEKLLGLNREITNVNGSGIALGHPVGATGIRIVVTLIHEMAKRDLRWGLATLCVGGGMGKAVVLERL
jgi:acetyl-CoA C-acetyltransferase